MIGFTIGVSVVVGSFYVFGFSNTTTVWLTSISRMSNHGGGIWCEFPVWEIFDMESLETQPIKKKILDATKQD